MQREQTQQVFLLRQKKQKENALAERRHFKIQTEKHLCASDLTGTQTTSASVEPGGSTVDNSLNALHVGLPCTVGTAMGMRNLNSKGNALAANITLCHFNCTSFA